MIRQQAPQEMLAFLSMLKKCHSEEEIMLNWLENLKTLIPEIQDTDFWFLKKDKDCPRCQTLTPSQPRETLALHKLNKNPKDKSCLRIDQRNFNFIEDHDTALDTIETTQQQLLQINEDAILKVMDHEDHRLGLLTMYCYPYLNENDSHLLNLLIEQVGEILVLKRLETQLQQAELRSKVNKSLLKEEIAEHRGFGYIVGHSPPLKDVLEKVEMVAPTDASVLITGESGTGKELIARAIHERSSRSQQPLIRVNCASIPKELFESEFFGHVKGAFTGAHRNRDGRFQMADGGTLFLDEIGEIPIELQSKLLRVLQEEQFEKVGDDQTHQVNVRIIAATNRNLISNPNLFRQDLYYRLSVFPIENPSLKDRIDDIKPLAQHFIREACHHFHKAPVSLTKKQLHELENYNWPGNIRELKNVIERAVITSKDGLCQLDHLLLTPSKTTDSMSETNDIMTQEEIHKFEKDNLLKAMRKARGKISGSGGAATILNVSASTLASRISKMGLTKEDFIE
jgi:transcriptional regulator with GAF, ATPase, and Fis domain